MLRKHLNLPNLLFFREKQDHKKGKKEEDSTNFLYEARKRKKKNLSTVSSKLSFH